MTVSVLGTAYTIRERSDIEDPLLKDCDGYCDKTTKEIVIATKCQDSELKDFEAYRRKVLRHEIIHAFLFESGLHENWKHDTYGHDESYAEKVLAENGIKLDTETIMAMIDAEIKKMEQSELPVIEVEPETEEGTE